MNVLSFLRQFLSREKGQLSLIEKASLGLFIFRENDTAYSFTSCRK